MQNNMQPKKVLCIHDFSVLGRCSLAVIAPVLSSMGYQVVALPTVVLSTHTGGLGAPAVLKDDAFGSAALAHYASLGVTFDCIYTGYLGGMAGISLAKEAFTLFPEAIKVVDPVMGDHGKAYTSITPELMQAMRALATQADYILPNFTEAHLLLQLPYPEPATAPITSEQASALAENLLAVAKNVVITGVPLPNKIGCAGAGAETFWVQQARLSRNFPGTGDLYGAVLVGLLLRGNALSAAAEFAANFISSAILNTPEDADTRFGVCFEPLLAKLLPDATL